VHPLCGSTPIITVTQHLPIASDVKAGAGTPDFTLELPHLF